MASSGVLFFVFNFFVKQKKRDSGVNFDCALVYLSALLIFVEITFESKLKNSTI